VRLGVLVAALGAQCRIRPPILPAAVQQAVELPVEELLET
jgi:hypothetical protein